MSSKKQNNRGHPILPHIQQAVEDADKEQGKPRGMPTLAQLRSECARQGLPDSDAEYLFDHWAMNGYKTGRGMTIKNYQAAVRVWRTNGWLPSQKKGVNKDARDQALLNEQFKRFKQK